MQERVQRADLDAFEAMEIYVRVAEDVSFAKDIDSMFEAVWRGVLRFAECETMMISAYDAGSGLVRAVYVRRSATIVDVSGFPGLPLDSPDAGTQSRVIRSGEGVLFDDFRSAWQTCRTRYVYDEEARAMRAVAPPPAPEDQFVPPSALMVPLRFKDASIGVLAVFSTSFNAYSKAQLDLLQKIGDTLGSRISEKGLRH